MKVGIALEYALGTTMLVLGPTTTMVYQQPCSLDKLSRPSWLSNTDFRQNQSSLQLLYCLHWLPTQLLG
jgi:hypothetical protein